MTFVLTRVINRTMKEANTWTEYKIKKTNKKFYVSDEDFAFLFSLPKEYDYKTYDNELYIDRHPDILREQIDDEEFLEDYTKHLSDKYFVLYECKKVG